MNWRTIENDWNHYRNHISSTWTRLNYSSIERTCARRDLLVRCLQDSYGMTLEDADDEVMRWQQSLVASA